MAMHDIFLNDKFQLRAGWRILAFILVYVVIGFVLTTTMALLFKVVPMPKLVRDGVATLMLAGNAALSAWVLLKWLDKRSFVSLGLIPRWGQARQVFEGILIGFAMLTAAVCGMWMLGYEEIGMASFEWEYILAGLAGNLFLYTAVGFNEEILFRGYIFQAMTEGTGKVVATVIFSLLFGLAHAGNPNVSVFGLINVMLAGVLLSIAYLQTRALWLPIGIHIGWNFTQGYIWGLPVSGTTQIDPLTISQETGPDLLTGGTFGPEGGAACTIVCLLACLAVLKFYRPAAESLVIEHEAQSTGPFRPVSSDIEENPAGV